MSRSTSFQEVVKGSDDPKDGYYLTHLVSPVPHQFSLKRRQT